MYIWSGDLLKCRQMSEHSENDAVQEDLRLSQLMSPRWSDDDNVDTPRQSVSLDRFANCHSEYEIYYTCLQLKAEWLNIVFLW